MKIIGNKINKIIVFMYYFSYRVSEKKIMKYCKGILQQK